MAKKKEPKTETKKVGRPTIYTPELGEKICKAIENTPQGLRTICARNPDFPTDETVRDWLRNDTFPDFSLQYARARENQSELLADEVVDVAYQAKPDKFGRVEKAKLQVDALKWKAGKMKPKKYGDNPDKYLNPKDDEAAKTTKESLSEKIGKITGLLAKKKKIIGEEK